MFSLDQYDAAHTSAVISESSTRGTIALAGADRRSFLHALLTNDIATLAKGKGVYAAYLTPQGRMISDMRIIETGERLLLGVERPIAAALAERFDKLIFSEDVQVSDVSNDFDEVGIYGPLAANIFERTTGISVTELANEYDNLTAESFTVTRDDGLGLSGFDVYVPRDAGPSLREKFHGAGAVQASAETLEVLRIEAGRPRFGIDMSTDTIPLEAGIEDRAISFTKGCYVGQEVIIRVMHRGHGRIARRLVRLVLPGAPLPSQGDKVFSGGQQAGEITSAVESPKVGGPMAMAYVHRDHTGPGTELLVNGSKAFVYQPGNELRIGGRKLQ
jgi:folate-binding protein YgfZ